MVSYIDFHAHNKKSDNKSLVLQNIYLQDIESIKRHHFFTTGLHPWHLDCLSIMESYNRLNGSINIKGLVAIGECGLDKYSNFDLELQMEFLRIHLIVAAKYHKPLLVHCVKRHGELLAMIKEEKFKERIILHGFDGKLSLAEQLLEHHFELSFGKALFLEEHYAASVLKELPRGTFWLESDDADCSIEDIYKKASEIRGCSVDELKDDIYTRWQTLVN